MRVLSFEEAKGIDREFIYLNQGNQLVIVSEKDLELIYKALETKNKLKFNSLIAKKQIVRGEK